MTGDLYLYSYYLIILAPKQKYCLSKFTVVEWQ